MVHELVATAPPVRPGLYYTLGMDVVHWIGVWTPNWRKDHFKVAARFSRAAQNGKIVKYFQDRKSSLLPNPIWIMSIQVNLHQGESFKDKHFSIVLVL